MKLRDEDLYWQVPLLTIILCVFGFGLLEMNLVPYGFTLFCIIPIIIGYIIGQMPKFKITLAITSLFAICLFLYLLKIGGLESLFCILTLSPLLFGLLFLGMFIGFKLREYITKKKNNNITNLKVYTWPVLLLLATGTIEKFFTEKYAHEAVVTTITLPYSPEMVFDYVKSFDTLQSEKPFLFKIGIQTPLKCVLKGDSVGALRTCYFKEGTIDEVVTDFNRGKILKMAITKYNMPGRKWLHFKDAVYTFTKHGDSTVLTRTTTYMSELKPRIYWHPWETKAIEAEHDYVLRDLKRRLNEAKNISYRQKY